MKTVDFRKLIKEHLKPKFNDLGFDGRDHHFIKRTNEHFIYTLVIQAWSDGGSCILEMGVHLDFLPNTIGKFIEPNEFTTYDCEFRKRLGRKISWMKKILNKREEPDGWFPYGDNELSALNVINEMYIQFQNEGLRYFNQFVGFPNPITSIELGDLKQRNKYLENLGAPLDLRLALLIARTHQFLGNQNKATQFAKWGIENVKGNSGIGLINEFDKLIQGR